ncbi:hypothetical protein [Breoghania sp.]|uniref:hypothetical protein n=1 Tax=Breoghania sp. TaxID=2065378 RepID=UPI002AAB5050|nr:hypothetical protein [Breoghania sp.]
MSANPSTFRAHQGAASAVAVPLCVSADASDHVAGLVFDLMLASAAQETRCRPVAVVLLTDEERETRRAVLVELWRSCSSRIIDEGLVSDLLARRGNSFLALAGAMSGIGI